MKFKLVIFCIKWFISIGVEYRVNITPRISNNFPSTLRMSYSNHDTIHFLVFTPKLPSACSASLKFTVLRYFVYELESK